MPWWVSPWVGISALAIGVLLSLRPVFLLVERVASGGITPGVATLLGALIGFSAVAWQARVGFRNLIRSQTSQSELDRKAREHEAELVRREKESDRRHERITLAGALSGELGAAYSRLANGRSILRLQASAYKAMGNSIPPLPIDMNAIFPKFEPKVFNQNIGGLGLLGPSTASDVVEVYQVLFWDRSAPPSTALAGKQLASIVEMQIKVIDQWLLDCYHVNQRLLSVFGSIADPGPLIMARQKREEPHIDNTH
ncbi:hypothetical protein [Chelativorans alearense]|uniref:hypothetical protein n=1 Tax=Chelativorans alearense TaxID=2681495 RepID=UPI0013D53A48|nr:hypothetical protein [Chelativorans alearense]